MQLLETMVKNCGDYVHFQIAEKNILQEMIKIVKKKVGLCHILHRASCIMHIFLDFVILLAACCPQILLFTSVTLGLLSRLACKKFRRVC